jgi:dihydroneopterin aldolase/2-amino-4-hydroxy-6-hydroxymethyldihydropteridine diphosphokinase
MPEIYLSLGTNQGNREKNLQKALNMIRQLAISSISLSTTIETKPYGYLEQGLFLNMAIGGITDLNPYELLSSVKKIESALGRKKTFHWGPRLIDIDILFYENLIMNEKDLIIPHPDIENRIFVLQPLVQIAPHFIHPVLKKNMITLLSEIVA